MKALVLGGAGAMAEAIERDLLEHGAEVIIGDRDATKLKDRFRLLKSRRLKTVVLDIKNKRLPAIIHRLRPDVIVNATWYVFNAIVMKAAIKAGVPYVDLGGLYWKTIEQLKLHGAARRAGVTCVLGMGSTPGTMNLMAKYAASMLDTVERMELRCGGRLLRRPKDGRASGFTPAYSIRTMIDEITLKAPVLRDGRIIMVQPLATTLTFTLPKPIGKVTGHYTIHSELATLPRFLRSKGLRHLDFAYAYDETMKLLLKTIAKRGPAGAERLASPHPLQDPKDVEVLRVDARGKKGGKPCRVRVEAMASYHKRWKKSAATVDTGVPASIVGQWLAEGRVARPGVWAPEDILEPLPFFKELRRRGIMVYQQVNDGQRRPIGR